MATNYSDMKQSIDALIKSAEGIDAEAVSFSNARKELDSTAAKLGTIATELKSIIKGTDAILYQVKDAAVEGTVLQLRNSADSIQTSISGLLKEISENNRTLQDSYSEKTDTVVSEFKSGTDSVIRYSDEITKATEKNIADIRKTSEDLCVKVSSENKNLMANFETTTKELGDEYKRQLEELRKQLEDAVAGINKKVILLGGISVVCTVVAAILSVLL